PTELDVLYVLKDECDLSATYDHDGFAITVTFENYQPACPPPAVQAFLRDMTAACADNCGRIHLVKNVYADTCVMRQTLKSSLEHFTRVKQMVDPGNVLWNPFLERLTGIPQ